MTTRNTWIVVAAVGILAFVAGTQVAQDGAQVEQDGTPTQLPDTEEKADSQCTRQVRYYVEGSATAASLTMTNETGGTEQLDNRAVPREWTVGDLACGESVYLSAQNQHKTGTIGCRIEADGILVQEATSDGAYAIATCSGSVPS